MKACHKNPNDGWAECPEWSNQNISGRLSAGTEMRFPRRAQPRRAEAARVHQWDAAPQTRWTPANSIGIGVINSSLGVTSRFSAWQLCSGKQTIKIKPSEIKVRLPGEDFPRGFKTQWVIFRPRSPWFISQSVWISFFITRADFIIGLVASDHNNYNKRAQPRKRSRNIPLFSQRSRSRENVFSSELVKSCEMTVECVAMTTTKMFRREQIAVYYCWYAIKIFRTDAIRKDCARPSLLCLLHVATLSVFSSCCQTDPTKMAKNNK